MKGYVEKIGTRQILQQNNNIMQTNKRRTKEMHKIRRERR